MVLLAPTEYCKEHEGAYVWDCLALFGNLGELLQRMTEDVDVESSKDLKELLDHYKMGLHLGLWDIGDRRVKH